MSDDDYCNNCKVKIMDGNCFCDWPDNEDVEYESAERLSEQYEQEGKDQEFRDKIRSINFSKVKGGARR